jgi:hypothetical protein
MSLYNCIYKACSQVRLDIVFINEVASIAVFHNELMNPSANLFFFDWMTKMPFVLCSNIDLMSYKFYRNSFIVMRIKSHQILPRCIDSGKGQDDSVD